MKRKQAQVITIDSVTNPDVASLPPGEGTFSVKTYASGLSANSPLM